MIELIESETTAISEYQPVEAGLAELRRKYANVAIDVSTPKALAEAARVRAEIREPRYETEKIRKLIKAPALAFAKLIDTEAARITHELLAIETPWDDAIKAEELRKEQEKADAERKERARVDAIVARIDTIKGFVGLALECRTAAMVATLIEKLNDGAHCTPSFEEFEEEALRVMQASMDRLNQIHAAKLAEEAERERIRAEQEAENERLAKARAELDQQRREQAERDKEAARLAAIERDRDRDELARQRETHEAEMRTQRALLNAERAELERQKPEPLPTAPSSEPDTYAPLRVVPNTPPRPSDKDIVKAVASHFDVDYVTALVWLETLDYHELNT